MVHRRHGTDLLAQPHNAVIALRSDGCPNDAHDDVAIQQLKRLSSCDALRVAVLETSGYIVIVYESWQAKHLGCNDGVMKPANIIITAISLADQDRTHSQ